MINRSSRQSLAGVLHAFAAILALLAAVQASHAQAPAWGSPVPPRPESEALALSVPIADVHMHFHARESTVRQMLQLMEENNVRWGGGVGDYDARLQEALGRRYIPTLGQPEFTRVLLSDGEAALQNVEHPVFVRFFREAEALMAAGKARGFGEIHISNRDSVGVQQAFERMIPLDSPVVRRMYEIANTHGGFVQIHYNKDATTVDQILAMAQRYPRALTIVSHCMSRGVPADMRRLFEGAPNVMCELSGSTHLHGVERVVSRDGIRSGWLRLVEDFPDRVMLGTDPCCGLMRRYGEIVQVLRTKALAAMRPQTLEMVAFRNAVRVFGLGE